MRRAGLFELLAFALVACWLVSSRPAAAIENPRALVLAMDSIPLSVVEEYIDTTTGRVSVIANLHSPAGLVSSFPAVSYSAWTGILEPFGVPKPLGYYGKFYDLEQGVVTGFRSDWLTPQRPVEQSPWLYFFDWRLDDVFDKAIAYLWPEGAGMREVRAALEAFELSDQEQFFAYVISTDALAHTAGPGAFFKFLRDLDDALMERADNEGNLPFTLVLLSDHGVAGGEVQINVWPEVEEALVNAGFRMRESIEDGQDVVIIGVGMVSAFEVYSADEKRHGIARSLGKIPGIELCVSKEGQAVRVFGDRGTGIIRRKSRAGAEDLFSYESSDVDPLGFDAIVAGMGTLERDPSTQWFSDSRWFEATQASEFPDALYRLYHSFEAVENTASLLCSLEPGYAFGAKGLEWMSWLAHGDFRWTHGALSDDNSIGFIATNAANWRPTTAVRFNQALRFLRESSPTPDTSRSTTDRSQK